MSKSRILTWRHFVSGLVSLAIGCLPMFVQFVWATRGNTPSGSAVTLAPSFFAVVLLFALLVGLLVEAVVIPKFVPARGWLKSLLAYAIFGALVIFGIVLFTYGTSMLASGPNFLGALTGFGLMWSGIFGYYLSIALPTRAFYPFVHKLLWRKPYFGAKVAARETE